MTVKELREFLSKYPDDMRIEIPDSCGYFLFDKTKSNSMRLLKRFFCRKIVLTLPEPNGWLANAVIGCLRTWKRQSGPGPWIVTTGDIEYLARWAADLQQQYEKTGRQFKVTTYPEKVR